MYEFALRLNKDVQEPLFKQLYSYIKKEIVSGKLVHNDKLPSKRRLASGLQCSQNTVQAAYNQLVDEGYLIPQAKSGYFVARLDGILDMQSKPGAHQPEEKKADDYRYDFSHNGVDYDSFPFTVWRRLTKETISEYDRDLLRTGDPQGYAPLRREIARYLHHSRGVACAPEQIVISSGTEYLMQLLIQLFGAENIYAIENPGYEKLSLLFKSSRAECRAVDVDENGMQPKLLEESGANVACITPSHQFPTGVIMPISRRIQMLNWAGAHPGRYIIEDDYDSEFRYSGKPIPSMQGLDKGSKVIYIGAFSKSLSPALRISYMVLPKQLLDIYNSKLSFYICPVPTIEQKTLQRFMDEGHFERHLNRMRNVYKQKRERLIFEIHRTMPNARVIGANAGLHFVLEVQGGMAEEKLILSARERGVKLTGYSRYSSMAVTQERQSSLVLGFATLKMKEIEEAVQLLSCAWEQR